MGAGRQEGLESGVQRGSVVGVLSGREILGFRVPGALTVKIVKFGEPQTMWKKLNEHSATLKNYKLVTRP